MSVLSSNAAESEPKDGQWVNQVFQKGKAFYESGDYVSASREWDKLGPYLDQYPSLNKVISYLQGQVRNQSGSLAVKSPVPSQPAASIRSASQKGRVAYENGDWATALEEWTKIEPQLDPSSEEAKLLQKIKKDHEMLKLAKKQEEAVSAEKNAAVKTPGEFAELLKKAQASLQKQILEIQTRQASIEKDAVFEEAWINTTFENGKTAYETGNYDLAIEEWDKLAFKMGEDSAIKDQIERLKESRRNFREAELIYSQAVGEKQALVYPGSAEMQRFMKEAAADLRAKADEVSRQSGEKQRSIADQQKRVNETFEKGKALYLQGKHREAIDEWLLLSSYFEGDLVTKAAFLSAQGSAQAYDAANATYRNTVDSGAYKLGLPDGFFRYLENANHELAAQSRQAEADREKTEVAVASKRAELMQALEEGKKYYAQGRVMDAVAEWKKIAPWVENGEVFKTELQKLEANGQEAARQSAALKEAKARSAAVYSAPQDLAQLLQTTNEDLKNQITAATNERIAAEQQSNDKRARISAILYKASLAYKAGKLAAAVEEWEKLIPYLGPAAEERILIETLSQNYKDYTAAMRQQSEIRQKKDVAVQIPEDLKASLSIAHEGLLKDTAKARAESETLAADLSERKAVMTAAIEKGRSFYQAGRLDQAIAEWEKLLPYMDRASQERLLIEDLAAAYAESREAAADREAAAGKKDAKIDIPEDLKKTLAQASQELAKKAAELRAQRESIETKYNDRQTFLMAALEKAQVYTKAGRPEEALAEWKKISDSFEESSNARTLIRDLESNLLQYRLAKQTYEDALPKKDAKFPLPEGMAGLIDEARQTLAREEQGLKDSLSKLEKDTQAREDFIKTVFENGKNLLSQNKRLEAVYEWEKLIPYLDEKSGLAVQLAGIKKAHQTLEETKRSNEIFIASEYQGRKIPFADEMEKILIDLDGKIQAGLKGALDERAKMEKALTEREVRLTAAFAKGKAYYEVGKYKEAIEFWSSISEEMKDDPTVRTLLAGLPQRYQNLMDAQKAAEAAAVRKDAPLPWPAELTQILDEMTAKINAQNMEMISRAEKASQAGDERIRAMNQIFQQGKTAYDEGRLEEAVKIWSALPPYLEEEARVKAMIDNLAASHRNFVDTQRSAEESEARLSAKFPAPADLSAVLADAAFKLDKERQATELSRERTEKIITEKQQAVQKIYDEGKAFYDQGKLSDAFAAWRSLAPSVSDENQLLPLLTKADESYQMYLAAKEQNQQLLAKKEMKLSSPDELGQILETANQQLRDQVFDLKTRTSQTEKMLEDRKSWIEVTFQKGKLAHSQGRYQEAVAEWRTLLPFVENGALLEKQLSDFEQNLKVSLESSKINAEADQKKTAKFIAPDELGALLVELNEKVKNEAFEASAEKIRADQQYSERQKWMKQTFDLGKAFYLEGKYDQALGEWEKFGPYLDEQSGVLKLIEAVRQSYAEASVAKKAAVEAAAGDYQGLKLPYAEQMTALLTEADAKLRTDAAEYAVKKSDMEKTMAERQEWSVTTFNKGKIFYDQGRIDEALGQWERLLPYMEEGGTIKERILSLRESYDKIVAGKNALGDPSSGERPVKLQNEEEILGVLDEALHRFRGEAEEARMKRMALEKSFEQRKAWIEDTFQKGKTYYEQGNYSRAVEEWGTLGPYLGEHPKVRDSIEALKKDYSEGRYAKQIIESMEVKKAALAPAPVEAEETPVPQALEEAPPADVPQEAASGEPVQLVSGEIVSVNEPDGTVTLKLFTESGSSETLTVNFDEGTQVDGSSPNSLSAEKNGSSIDVRYNPQTSRAVYIYVY